MEQPRSTAYYYGDLEKLKRQKQQNDTYIGVHRPIHPEINELQTPNQNIKSEYVETNEIFNDGAVNEVPPLRDRLHKQRSLPEYERKDLERGPGETYSSAGTFPMREPKEKEPLLAELEVVGRLPLNQLDNGSVRRSRSWYLCCPNVADDELSRESSWRYSSLRPVTAPPLPNHNGVHIMVRGHPNPLSVVSRFCFSVYEHL